MTDKNPVDWDDDDIDETLPDVVKDALRSGIDLEEIKLDDRGRWTHEGLDFENQRIIDLFSRSVDRTDGGTWVLQIDPFTYPITVEDTGFFVDRIDFDTSPPTIGLSDGTTETLDPETLDYAGDGKLYCRVKDGEFRARFKWNAYHELAEQLVERDGDVYLELDDGREVYLDSFDELEGA